MRYFFRLDSGRHVAVDAFYYQRTYLGQIAGSPDRERTLKKIEETRTQMEPLWGKRRVHIVPPVLDETRPDRPLLPPVRITAWLTCYDPVVPGNAASELVVVWFRTEFGSETMEQVIEQGIRSLSWDELAQDFAAW